MTEKELQLQLCLLDLLIAIDKDIVDWRNYPEYLYPAIRQADNILDLWAGMNLEKIRDEVQEQLNQIQKCNDTF